MLYIKVRTQFEGFHKWIKAPKEVSFLRSSHRHIFHVGAKIQVIETDRELEYFTVLKEIKKIIDLYKTDTIGTESCEMIAEYILDYLESKYPDRRIEVEVSEDGENGSLANNYESYMY